MGAKREQATFGFCPSLWDPHATMPAALLAASSPPEAALEPCLPSATRFRNPIRELHDVDSTPHPPEIQIRLGLESPSSFRQARAAD